MAINRDLIDFAIEGFKKAAPTLGHNQILFDIYEGNLLPYIEEDFKNSFSQESYAAIRPRITPINILKRVVDKLSTIYAKPPKRYIKNGTPQDSELLTWYEESFQINPVMNISNELFNLHKTVTLEPFVDQMMPKLRAVPSDRSIMLSQDKVDPTRPTVWVKYMGRMKWKGEETSLLYIYTDDDFIPVTLGGDIVEQVLIETENLEATNAVGELPAVYVNRSYHSILPPVDTDVLRMTKVIPVLFSDLSFAVMMQSFSIIYGIDVDNQNLRMSPNAFWTFKSDPASKNKPEIGMLKPSVDITEVNQHIMSLFSTWLHSKGIRPGTIGQLAGQSDISGISKMIDEMDTSEDRQKQVQHFMKAEKELWQLVTKSLHPYWQSQRMIETPLNFSPQAEVVVEFQEQLPMTRRSDLLKDILLELKEGLTTKKRALKTLNPEMKDDDIEALMEEVEEEKESARSVVEVPEEQDEPEEQETEGEDDVEEVSGQRV